ncbi:MAG: hypothetical protein K8R46_11755 [Pirellulales bacterium]|nr:hypothetical protein [Pirellulales bacterium]
MAEVLRRELTARKFDFQGDNHFCGRSPGYSPLLVGDKASLFSHCSEGKKCQGNRCDILHLLVGCLVDRFSGTCRVSKFQPDGYINVSIPCRKRGVPGVGEKKIKKGITLCQEQRLL